MLSFVFLRGHSTKNVRRVLKSQEAYAVRSGQRERSSKNIGDSAYAADYTYCDIKHASLSNLGQRTAKLLLKRIVLYCKYIGQTRL